MKKFHYILMLFAICNLQFTFCTYAQAPQSFNYQLITRDNAGLVLSNKTIGIQISILKDASDGAVVFSERHTATTNNYGLANLTIGTGSIISGSFGAIDWAHHTHFLKLEIDPSGGLNYFTMGTTQLVSVPYSIYAENAGTLTDTNLTSKWTQAGENIYNNNSGNVGIGINAPDGKLIVKGDSLALASEPLFEVKNKDGEPVFVVYPDSVRIIISQSASKANAQGGFAVSGRSSSKGTTSDYLVITPDSTRIYLEESSNKANALGGFAVSGRSSSKGTSTDYLNVSVDTTETIYPGEPRILWYPTKEAFLTGKVLIESKDSVGKNSFASGFESKSVGDWSQALGYHARAYGDNSTAIGNYANAMGYSSFAFGDSAVAKGIGAYAIGSVGRDTVTGNSTGNPALALGDYSFAIGLGTKAEKTGAIAMGNNSTAGGRYSFTFGVETNATGDYSTAMGYQTTASGYTSVAMGQYTLANGVRSTAMGYKTTANGSASTAMGYKTTASEYYSTAMGYQTTASGNASTAMGYQTTASGIVSTAMGCNTTASGNYSTALAYYTKAKSYASLVIGRYNDTTGTTNSWVPTDPLFVIGNGSSGASRSNAMTVLKNGNTGIGITAPNSKLDVLGDIRVNDNAFYLRGGTDVNHGIKYASTFAGASIDGPALFGWSGGVLGTVAGSETIALRWDNNNNVFMPGNVGIGTTSPNSKVHINSATGEDGLRVQINGNTKLLVESGGGVSIGVSATPPANGLYVYGNVGIGTASPNSKFEVAGGESNFYSGTYTDPVVGFVCDAKFGGSNNGIAVRGQSYFADKVGIGTSLPATSLHVNHPNSSTNGLSISNAADADRWHFFVHSANTLFLYFNNAQRGSFDALSGTYTALSDKRFKKNITPVKSIMNKVMELQVVEYNFINQTDKKRYIGLIAQDVESVFPSLVSHADKNETAGENTDIYTLDYASTGVIAIKAVQEIQILIEQLQTENTLIKMDNTILKSKVLEIENLKAENQNMKLEIENIKTLIGASSNK